MVLVAAGVLLGLVGLLAVPLGVAFQLEGIEAFHGRLTIRWLFGLVRIRVAVPGARKPAAEPKAGPKAARRRARRKRRGAGGRVVAVLREAPFRRRVRRLVGDLVRAVHVGRLRLRMRLGLGDPADTGCLWAFVGPLSAASQGLRRADVRIEPEFAEAVLEFRARGRVRVVPLQVLALTVAFALSPSSIRTWRALWSGHA